MWVEVADSAPTDFLETYSKLLDIQIYYYTHFISSRLAMKFVS